MKTALSYLIFAAGIFIALFSLLADIIGLGKSGIQAAQILGMEIGLLIALSGVALVIVQKKMPATSLRRTLRNKIYDLPPFLWVAVGILPAFIPFLVAPMFFDPSFRIQYPAEYLRQIVPIGTDLRVLLTSMEVWFLNGQTTYAVFTPLVNILFAPLLLIGYPASYYVITIATVISFSLLGFLAALMSNRENWPAILFIIAISIFSYGLQFELERGQSHTIALMLAVLAIYIFHRHTDFRLFAFLLFSISIQMKIYPALLVVMFVDDWRDWKINLRRFAALGLANFLLLFLLGFSYFSQFFDRLAKGVELAETGMSNHSIRSFAAVLGNPETGLLNGNDLAWAEANASLVQNLLYGYFLICFAAVLINAWLKNARGINFDLLLVCVIGGIVLPTVSHDYTLPVLAAPFAMSISDWHKQDYPWGKMITILLTVIISFTYALTLFPFTMKPVYLQNALPMLFIILTAVALLNIARKTPPLPQPLPA